MWCGSRCFVTPLPTALFLDHPPVDLGPSHRRVALSRKIKIETPLNISVNRSRIYTKSVINNCSPQPLGPPSLQGNDYRCSVQSLDVRLRKLPSQKRGAAGGKRTRHAPPTRNVDSPPLKAFGRPGERGHPVDVSALHVAPPIPAYGVWRRQSRFSSRRRAAFRCRVLAWSVHTPPQNISRILSINIASSLSSA